MYEISCRNCEFFVNIFGYEQEAREICEIHSKINYHTSEYVEMNVYPHKTVRLERHTTNAEDVILKLLDSNDNFMPSVDQYRKILMKGPGNFGTIFSTSLRPKDSKFPNFSVGNIDIYLPLEIFDKIVNMLGEEYRKNIRKDVTDSDILKIDDRITLVKNEDRVQAVI
jgi:hypothetical protein